MHSRVPPAQRGASSLRCNMMKQLRICERRRRQAANSWPEFMGYLEALAQHRVGSGLAALVATARLQATAKTVFTSVCPGSPSLAVYDCVSESRLPPHAPGPSRATIRGSRPTLAGLLSWLVAGLLEAQPIVARSQREVLCKMMSAALLAA